MALVALHVPAPSTPATGRFRHSALQRSSKIRALVNDSAGRFLCASDSFGSGSLKPEMEANLISPSRIKRHSSDEFDVLSAKREERVSGALGVR
jgi:hypothetical protein